MPFPNFEGKHQHDSMVSPQEFLAYLKELGLYVDFDPPNALILCYQTGLIQYVLENHKTTAIDLSTRIDLYMLDETDPPVAIAGGFGIGAPATVLRLEQFIAAGVSKFLSIGAAGGLQKHQDIGDIVVCDRAIRDEGTSHHYLEPSKYSYASSELTERAKQSLERLRTPFEVGTTWTVDAPYRETIAEVMRCQTEGVLTVEMEAAALFAVAQYRNVQMGSILTVSDTLGDLTWNPQFVHAKTQAGLETLYRVAVDVLT